MVFFIKRHIIFSGQLNKSRILFRQLNSYPRISSRGTKAVTLWMLHIPGRNQMIYHHFTPVLHLCSFKVQPVVQNTEVMSNEPFFLSEQKTTPVKIFYVAQESGEWGRSQHELVLIEVYSCGQIIVQNLVIVITMWRTSQYVKKKKKGKKIIFFSDSC